MAKIDLPIVSARYTDEDHNHAFIAFQGEHEERLISKKNHPQVWAEMLRSVVLTHHLTPPPMTIPVPSIAVAPPTVNVVPEAVQSDVPVVIEKVVADPIQPKSITVNFLEHTFTVEDVARLSLAVNLANAAMAHGVRGGDLRWLNPSADFSWAATDGTAVPMDAPTLIAFAGAVYSA